VADTTFDYAEIEFTKPKNDSALREQMEQDELEAEQVNDEGVALGMSIKKMHFFAPVKGLITSEFNAAEDHFGIDLVSQPDRPILATLAGTVVFADWTVETGYVIQIQHENNLVSVYKHNRSLFKRMGDRVRAGESVAIIGNTGELSSGPHLHFEIWHNGVAVNPKNYIVFE
jgi:murein DD-endopeptidase MepM/ murein hydrolase activator NlpD